MGRPEGGMMGRGMGPGAGRYPMDRGSGGEGAGPAASVAEVARPSRLGNIPLCRKGVDYYLLRFMTSPSNRAENISTA